MDNLLIVPGGGVIIDRDNGNYILNVKTPQYLEGIKAALPDAYTQPYQDSTLVVLPIHDDTLQILRNVGVPTAGMEPFYWEYKLPLIEGKFQPKPHQITSAAFMSSHRRAFNTSTPRTGKTGATVMTTDYLQTVKKVPGAVLIVATVSNLIGVWRKTLVETFPQRRVVVVHGGSGKKDRLKRLREDAHYYIINYDGIKMVEDELIHMVKCGKINIVVVDELTHYGNTTNQRFKALDHIVNNKEHPVPYCYGLTGSPGGNSVAVFGFVKLINPSKMPAKYMSTWRDLVQFRYGSQTWMFKDRPDAPQIIHRAMQPNIRFEKKDVIDLPPVIRQMRDFDLTPEQNKVYKQLRDESIAYLSSGESVEARIKAALLHKVLQTSLGSVKLGDGKVAELPNEPRIKTIIEAIKEAEYKVVIFCAYTDAINRRVAQLRKAGYTVEKVDGSVTGKKRNKIFEDFQNKKDPHILIAHPETTAFGVELAAADMMIYDGPPISGGFVYEQSLERPLSEKQKADQVVIIQIAGTPMEREAFKNLDAGTKVSEMTNSLFRVLVD